MGNRSLIRKVRALARRFCHPQFERDDFEQEIWLALCEGRMDLDDLEKPGSLLELVKDCRRMKLKSMDPFYIGSDHAIWNFL